MQLQRRIAVVATSFCTLAAVAVGLSATPAFAATTVNPTTLVNNNAAATVTIDTADPALAVAGSGGTAAEMEGPGSATNTIDGTNTTVTGTGCPSPSVPVGCTGANVTSTFDLVSSSGLPAGPGSYKISACLLTSATCTASTDSTTIAVTGAAPVPSGLTTTATSPGTSDSDATISGSGFANGDTVSFSQNGTAASGITFAPDYTKSSADSLQGTLTVGSSVAAGSYNLTVTDTSTPTAQTGTKAGALTIGSSGSGGGSGSTGTPGVSPSTFANTVTAQQLTITTSTPGEYTTPTGASVQLAGPGSQTPDYDFSATATDTPSGCTLVTCTGSTVTTTANLDPNGLPAAPGAYTATVCAGPTSGDTLSCQASQDKFPLTVTGAKPAPAAVTSTTDPIKPGDTSDAVTIAGMGFADGDKVTFSQNGTAATGITFTPSYSTSSATALKGTLAVSSSVADGSYDVTVTDTSTPAQSGTKTGALVIGSSLPTSTSLTLSASATQINYGQKLTLAGQLTAAQGGTVSDQTIELLGKLKNGGTFVFGAVKTDSTGHYTATFAPHDSATYATYYPGTDAGSSGSAQAASFSSSDPAVSVVSTVTAKAAKSKVKPKKAIVVTGRVSGNEAGHKIVLAYLSSSGARHQVATTTATRSSTYRFSTKSTKLHKKGTYRLVVVAPATTYVKSAVSKAVKVKRT